MEEVRIGEEVIVSKDLDEMRENGGAVQTVGTKALRWDHAHCV